MRLRTLMLVLLCATALVLIGSTPAPADTPGPRPKLGVLAPSARTLTVPSSGEFFWSQGDRPVAMGSSASRTCFLTGVSGDFEGGGERVRTYIVAGFWYLGGSSLQAGVTGYARCVPVRGSIEYSWSQGQLAQPMGSDADKACFLTSVTGHFEGGGEWVNTFATGGSWYLGGNSLQQGVAARARCVPVSAYSEDFFWAQGQTPEPMQPAVPNSCFLTSMAGRFKGGGELVHAFQYRGWWFLGGSSLQVGVSARSRCI